jgi:hypothetical protein
MGIPARRVSYLWEIFQREHINREESMVVNEGFEQCPKTQFYLKRDLTDYPGLCTFHSRVLAYFGYESMFARPLHWLLYLVREPFY